MARQMGSAKAWEWPRLRLAGFVKSTHELSYLRLLAEDRIASSLAIASRLPNERNPAKAVNWDLRGTVLPDSQL